MNWLFVAGTTTLIGFIALFIYFLWRKMVQTRHLPLKRTLMVLVGGAGAAAIALNIEGWAFDAADVSDTDVGAGVLITAMARILFAAPLKEALKAAVVWPLYVGNRLTTGQIGSFYAVTAAAGFSIVEVAFISISSPGQWHSLLRVGFAMPAHIFFAGLWGYMLGGGKRDRYFWLSWIACTILHGSYSHIVFDKKLELLIIVLPMLALMTVGVWLLVREVVTSPSSRQRTSSLFGPPSRASVRDVLTHSGRPLMVHWIVIGAFVNLGIILLLLALAVYWGHQYGVDFTLVDREGFDGMLPIIFLGSALLAAFPISGYLIARASGASSVLEPAWATGASIIVVLTLFSVTEPVALVIAMGVAPVGFTLACAGAWFGLERH